MPVLRREKIMAKLAEIIGLSFTDMGEITTWALCLVIFGVAMGNGLYDLSDCFFEMISSLLYDLRWKWKRDE